MAVEYVDCKSKGRIFRGSIRKFLTDKQCSRNLHMSMHTYMLPRYGGANTSAGQTDCTRKPSKFQQWLINKAEMRPAKIRIFKLNF